jgi:hypothetical protein
MTARLLFLSLSLFLVSGCQDGSVSEAAQSQEKIEKPQAKSLVKVSRSVVPSGESVDFSIVKSSEVVSVEWRDQKGKLLSRDRSFNRAFYDAGEYAITVTVTDAAHQIKTDTVVVKVTRHADQPIQSDNQPPVVKAKAEATDITEGEAIRLCDDGSYDPDGEIVSYAWRDMDGILLSSTKRLDRTMHYYPQYDFQHDGTNRYVKTLTVTDDKGCSSSKSFTIIVHKKPDSNKPPIVDAGVDQEIVEGASVTLQAAASDADGRIVSYRWKEGSVSVGNEAIVTLQNLSKGIHFFTITVTDDRGATASDTVKVTVLDSSVPQNHAPVADSAHYTTQKDNPVAIQLKGSDADGDTLTYLLQTQPEHGTLSGNAPNLTYTPKSGYVGSDRFTFVAKDEESQSDPATVTIDVVDTNRTGRNILFAHGYQSSKETWDLFAEYAQQAGYNVFRYDVPKDGSIEARATVLAQDIVDLGDLIADHSLLTVGHSMGGLDLRYIVSLGHQNQANKDDIFYRAAKKIAKIYTLASPHKGTSLPGVDDATKDMTDEHMKAFNEAYPYSTYTIDGYKVPLLAYRFKCGDAKVSDGSDPQEASKLDLDGVVYTRKQLFNGAPYTQTIFSGKHSEDAICIPDTEIELSRTDLLQEILDQNEPSKDVIDILFFDENSCQSDEGGLFSSSYKPGGVRCLDSEACDDNKIASVMLFPGIKPSKITLYSAPSDTQLDDWAVITIGDTHLDRPVCIGSFENGLPQALTDKNITLEYHKVEFGEDGLDGKVSYIDIE